MTKLIVSLAAVFASVSIVQAHELHVPERPSQKSSTEKSSAGKPGASTESSDTNSAATKTITEKRQLTYVGPRAGEGYFNSSGSLMIFQSEREEKNPFYQIYLLDRGNGRTFRVSPGQGKTTCAWIHPDNQKALFSSTHLDAQLADKTKKEYEERRNPVKGKYSWSFDETFDIFEAPIASSLKTGRPVASTSLKRLTKEMGYDAEASYSPNGRQIAFASNRAGYTETLNDEEKKLFTQDPSYMMDLYLMNADGTGAERLTTARGYDGGPFFSADGTKLTWRRFAPNGQYAEIMVMDLKTRKETVLTKMKAMSWAPYFHPSGDYIIFTSNKLGYTNFELFIVDVAGKQEPVRVSFLDGFDGLPVFLPSGNEISWTRRDEKGESQIYIANWDDGLARTLLGLSKAAPTFKLTRFGISDSDVKQWASYLTSETHKGRRPGTPEERVYVEAIGKFMRDSGLEPVFGKSFVQAFEFTSGVKLGPLNRLRIREKGSGSDLAVITDWMPLSVSKSGDVMEAPLAFVGYGITAPANDKAAAFDSYDGIEVGGKWAVALRDLPADIAPERRFHFHLYSRPQHKALVAKQKGAVGLILIDSPKDKSVKGLSQLKFEGAGEVGIPVIHVSMDTAKRLFAGSTPLKDGLTKLDKGEVWNLPLVVSVGGKVDILFEKSTALNVAGRVKGTKSQNALVLGAHGDHLGLGESGASLATPEDLSVAAAAGELQGAIHYGADDNASGVAALLEIARDTATHKIRPERDVIFAVWSAEELGVLGSTHFLKEWKGPKFHAYINMDMVGRLRESLFLQGIGSATEWRGLLEGWAEKWPLSRKTQIVTTADPYLPTDAMAFYMKEVPVLSFFTGSHAEYHSPRDRYETLNFPGIVEVAKSIQFVAQDLQKANSKLTWVKVESGRPQGGESRSFRLYLGTVPDYSQEGVKGVKISGTSKDSPAESAGLKAGDVIVGLGGIKVESIYDYVYCLQALKADVTVPIQVQRAGRTVEMKITPKLKGGG